MRAPFIGALIGLVVGMVLVSAVGFVYGPRLVNKYLPVVKIGIVTTPPPTELPNRMVSFYLDGEKLRPGEPKYYSFYVVNDLNQGVPVSAFKGNADCSKEVRPTPENADGKVTLTGLVNHKPGKTFLYHYCFSLIGAVEPGQNYRVFGLAGHEAWPYISVVEAKIPEFVPIKSAPPYGALVPFERDGVR